jgi:hypothetical protein
MSISPSVLLSLSVSVGAALKRADIETDERKDLANLIGFFVTYADEPKELTFLHVM